MDISKFPERILSGVAHLIWISILILIIVDKSQTEVISYFSQSSGGAAALFASAVIGFSFFFGNLFDNIIIIIVRLYMRLKKINPMPISSLDKRVIELNKDQVKDLQNKYTDKAFFRSIIVAGIFIIITSICWSYEHGIPNFSLVLFGICLELLIIIVYRTLRIDYNDMYNSLNGG
jgi:hypothetical protein